MPFENDDERPPVRLAGCEKSQHRAVIVYEVSAHSRSASRRSPSKSRAADRGGQLAVMSPRTMHELVADRFVALGRTWIDVASGTPVRLRVSYTGHVSDEIVRNDQCAERARLRHPLMNVLVDYGMAGSGRMFEAYSMGEPIRLSGSAASELLQHASRFMASRGLPLTAPISRLALREVVAAARIDSTSRDEASAFERRRTSGSSSARPGPRTRPATTARPRESG